jgi:hypothetical protein
MSLTYQAVSLAVLMARQRFDASVARFRESIAFRNSLQDGPLICLGPGARIQRPHRIGAYLQPNSYESDGYCCHFQNLCAFIFATARRNTDNSLVRCRCCMVRTDSQVFSSGWSVGGLSGPFCQNTVTYRGPTRAAVLARICDRIFTKEHLFLSDDEKTNRDLLGSCFFVENR